ncbi:hypothetical protein M7I_5558 [Glarea lozoyensis 74030]|uniref:Uncharacterized protein n=1 Tax=Glarea lozoyensis (strain ATCC 74030 / MF5533) TaxID=1104152 RepID=H0ES80_GLAL7|nr:hypothetical protein M7I_5558 [Glarea lozoyensis 74030]
METPWSGLFGKLPAKVEIHRTWCPEGEELSRSSNAEQLTASIALPSSLACSPCFSRAFRPLQILRIHNHLSKEVWGYLGRPYRSCPWSPVQVWLRRFLPHIFRLGSGAVDQSSEPLQRHPFATLALSEPLRYISHLQRANRSPL